jgi:hypothetical protein
MKTYMEGRRMAAPALLHDVHGSGACSIYIYIYSTIHGQTRHVMLNISQFPEYKLRHFMKSSLIPSIPVFQNPESRILNKLLTWPSPPPPFQASLANMASSQDIP